MVDIHWSRYPLAANSQYSREWLQIRANLCCAPNTIDAYARALDDYFQFCTSVGIEPEAARKVDIAAYVQNLHQRSHPRGPIGNKLGLASATIKQRLTIVRLYYDYLVEEEICNRNPAAYGSNCNQKRYNNRGQLTRRDLVVCPKKCPGFPTMRNGERFCKLLRKSRLEIV